MTWLTKALGIDQVRHVVGQFFALTLPRTKFDYAKEVGDGLKSSVVMAPVQWIQRAMQEARFRVVSVDSDGDKTEKVGHPLTELITNPNPFYSGSALWSATILSYLTAGNGFWEIARKNGGAGVPAEIWYMPHDTVKLKFPDDGSEFLSSFEFKPGRGVAQKLALEDVVHFRCGIDPNNVRLGLSPLAAVLREIFIDLEASNFSASILRNMGVPGLVISPKNEQAMSPDEVEAVKKWMKEAFTGDRRGQPLVMGAPTSVTEFGFSPDKMALNAVRNVAEERLCAALGIPAAVVGFGSGMEQTKVGATMEELRKLAWTNGIIPILVAFAAEVERSLLPEFGNVKGLRCEFDVSAVVALQDDQKALTERWDMAVRGGWATVAAAKRALGQDVVDGDEIYLRSFSTIEVPVGSPPRVVDPVTEAAALGDGETKQASAAQRRAGLAFVNALERLQGPRAKVMEGQLTKFFEGLGAAAVAAARGKLPSFEDSGAAPGDTKASAADTATVNRILAALDLKGQSKAFAQVYETHYLEVAGEVAKAGDILGLATNLPDTVARAVVSAGGKRAGLVDLTTQTREALFDALAQGRADGLGTRALARQIEGNVTAGPWRDAKTRARVIARTETRFAQNTSTIARAKDAGVEKFVVHDGRFGEPRSTDEHIARDGSIVTADAAERMRDLEHPNGTLSFSPIFDDDDNT